MSDDQSWTTFSRELMPVVHGELVDKGVLFNRGYANTSMCCPSRSEILTGLYEHHTGVAGNGTQLRRPTIVQALHDLGYRTSLTGKYLNSWPCGPRSEFDQWVCAEGSMSPPKDPQLNVSGTWTQFYGYTTDILADLTVDFIDATPVTEPFFAMYTPITPHLPADDDRCSGLPVDPYRPPSFDEETSTSGKPAYMQRGPLSTDEIYEIDAIHRKMTQAVTCLDPAIGTILSSLGDREENTLVFYVSDNGYLYGEHRASGKVLPYEESVRVPFVVRYPALTGPSPLPASDALVQNVDIAPTIAELAGLPWGADGRSLVPLLTGESATVRDGALLEHCQANEKAVCQVPNFNGIVTPTLKYVEYATGEEELYDLANDPYELNTVAGDPEWAAIETELALELAALRAPPPTDTTIVTGPQGIVGPGPHAFTYFSQSRFATYQCRLTLDGVTGDWFACDGQLVTVGPLAAGSYVFDVAGTDENGLSDSTPATRTFEVDLGPPTVIIDSGPTDPTAETSASFTFSSDEQGVTFTCSLDGSEATACDSGITYTELAEGPHSFSVSATDAAGNTGEPATYGWSVVALVVRVADFSFSPAVATSAQGSAVTWSFTGPSAHTVADSSGMGLFASPEQPPDTSFEFTFPGAGAYDYACTIHPTMVGRIKVGVLVSPREGDTGTAFQVAWASAAPPTGFVFDVQIRRPGSPWTSWLLAQTATGASFTPDVGSGTYSFRARLRNPGLRKASKYSPGAPIVVT